jgi:2'-5' RNA ligase
MTPYSIWFMPTGKINDELSEVVSRLSRQFSTPVFPPHLTLIGNLNGSAAELTAQTQQLSERLEPFVISLGAVGFLDEYFRCLFLRAEATPALLEANRQARRVFRQEQEPAYMPHLSLLYGHFEPQVKTHIVASIGREFNRHFSASQLHLFFTGDQPKDWYRVQKFEFQAR